MYDYTIYPDNNIEVFKDACKQIERYFPHWHKEELLIDVDGSTFQTYTSKEGSITVYDSYYIGAVYITSDIALPEELVKGSVMKKEGDGVMATWLTKEKKKELRGKTEYYRKHPEEAHRAFLKRDDGVVIITPPNENDKKHDGIGMIPVVTQMKSLVQVYFPERNQTLTYFNDQFDLKRGDFIFVDGKLEGIRGIVREVNKNFKIKVADYKKVISVADTNVSGRLHMAGSHFVSFNSTVLPYEKIRTWYLPPVKPEDEYETGNDDTVIILDKLGDIKVSQAVWERGRAYYVDNHVRYICVDSGHGKAIVEGEHSYEVEFDFADGEIRNLFCSCPCGYTCKHEVAAMMQLKETLELIEKHYADLHRGYFAAIVKGDLFRLAVDSHETGSVTL